MNSADLARAALARAGWMARGATALSSYVPSKPTAKQAEFLSLDCREAFYGGAARGGKSEALLMAALQYAHVPGYAALILRRTYADLSLPGALMDRARDWLTGRVAWHEKNKTWVFPSGATLTFGYLEYEKDKYRYQGSEFQFIAFDELTQFSETQYTYLFSRLTRARLVDVPTRMRAASNPGNTGHEWVKQRFLIEGAQHGRVFVPARLWDNPHVDADDYVLSLAELDSVTRARLLEGDWTIADAGSVFRREWFDVAERAPDGLRFVRYWDLAATEPHEGNRDPDYTAGALVGRAADGTYYLVDMVRARLSPAGVERLIRQTAERDGRGVRVFVEQEGGAAGVGLVQRYQREVLDGFAVRGDRPTGSKLTRAQVVAAKAEGGSLKLVRGAWLGAFVDEALSFTGDERGHDDQIDALAGAVAMLARTGAVESRRDNPLFD